MNESLGVGVIFQAPPHSSHLRQRMLVYHVLWQRQENGGRGPQLLGLQETDSNSENVVQRSTELRALVLQVLGGFRTVRMGIVLLHDWLGGSSERHSRGSCRSCSCS